MYSKQLSGFLASSRFSQIRAALVLQLPHLVFIFLTPQVVIVTPKMGCHLASKGAISNFNCRNFIYLKN